MNSGPGHQNNQCRQKIYCHGQSRLTICSRHQNCIFMPGVASPDFYSGVQRSGYMLVEPLLIRARHAPCRSPPRRAPAFHDPVNPLSRTQFLAKGKGVFLRSQHELCAIINSVCRQAINACTENSAYCISPSATRNRSPESPRSHVKS
jgi:hypothetical protein